MDKISIIIPCFNEEEALPIYYAEMKKVMDSMKKHTSFELLFVDDGSSDRTYEIMKDLHRKDGRCQYLSFSRNFGKEAAIYAGLQNASGDYAAIMDVDLQDPPSLLPDMYRILKEEAYDSVADEKYFYHCCITSHFLVFLGFSGFVSLCKFLLSGITWFIFA